jgi:hypothetical protein
MDREMVEKALNVCKKNAQLFKDLGINEFNTVYKATSNVLYAIKLQEDYGIKDITVSMVKNAEPNVYVNINEHAYIASMGKKYSRTISWSVDGSQPEDEVMFVLHFPTKAYIFGDSYPKELFKDMWNEIKTYNFKYVDDVNSNIYFSLENSAPIANEFQNILQKYYKRFKDEANMRRAVELRRELEKLENIG